MVSAKSSVRPKSSYMLGKKPMLEQSMNVERLGTLLERTVKFHEAVHLHAARAIVLIDGGLFP